MKSTKSINRSDIDGLLKTDMTDVWIKLNAKHLHRLDTEFTEWLKNSATALTSPEIPLTEFMLFKVSDTAIDISKLKQRGAQFSRSYLRAVDIEERKQHILEFSSDLGASKRDLKKDKSAFKRWFDRDAILDRFHGILSAEQQKLSFYLDRLSWIYSTTISKQSDHENFWKRYSIEKVIKPLLTFDGDDRVKVNAFSCLARVLRALPTQSIDQLVSNSTLQYIYRSALESKQDVLIQREALTLLGVLSSQSLQTALTKRLSSPRSGDDYFVRRHTISLIGEYQNIIPELQSLLVLAVDDPSPAVRQTITTAFEHSDAKTAMSVMGKLVLHDKEPAVRASSLLSLLNYIQRDSYFSYILDLIDTSFKTEKDSFVLKVLLKISVDALPVLSSAQLKQWLHCTLPSIESLHANAEKIEVRRASAQAREWFWLSSSPQAQSLYDVLIEVLDQLQEGKTIKLPKNISYQDDIQLTRVLSLIAQTDHGFTLENKLTGRFIRKGDRLKFRFWRFIHEMRHASTDKREANRHTTGRHFFGKLRAPSAIMSELAETKVPGEPLFISDEGGWRPYLPLVDDILSSLDLRQPGLPYQIITSEGITEITPPLKLMSRIKAQLKLTMGFERYARKRNWINSSQGNPASYISSFEKLGFNVRFKAHQNITDKVTNEDSQVMRFFPALVPFNFDKFSEQTKDYFFSVYENTLFHLGIFVFLLCGYFFSRHIYLSYLMRKARQSIPLVIGGWGTRGKSGTERLKAALFNALGYSVVSKTSGCEAMFLHSPAYGSLREMFLFRPYDKATIWEQMNVVRLSSKLNCDVFLWECMGLTPAYVHILQKHWMQDDIGTITNAYPDHEDLQGPAGHNIPRVMTNFIPKSSCLITTEEQMLPILKESAHTHDSKLTCVGWLEAGLLTPDVLERFPYEEHPYNIALVLAIADELKIDKDYALKVMADRVVADLGVLKTYPVATLDSRYLEFVMGMSANERFGALGNWSRMEFDQHDLSKDPEVWVTTVVNNRADRVPRSAVFASIIANDISADRHILIGGNLHALKTYIEDAWNDNLITLSLFDESGEQSAEQRLLTLAKRFRVPTCEAEVQARFSAMLNGLHIADERLTEFWREPGKIRLSLKESNPAIAATLADEIIHFLQQDTALWQEYVRFSEELKTSLNDNRQNTQQDQLQSEFNTLAWSWLERKIIIVDDYYASGNDVIDEIVKQTPPGLKARIMGMQNIKGTGLDYVYRWQAWENCYNACQKMLALESATAEAGLKTLSTLQEIDPLCRQTVFDTIEKTKDRSWAQKEEIQAEFVMIDSKIEQFRISADQFNNAEEPQKNSSWSSKLSEYIEAFLDAGDAVKRRKRANLIYLELQNQRISHDRAAMELQALNKRQKGGWAGEYVSKLRNFNEPTV